jgi:hypothetical protein
VTDGLQLFDLGFVFWNHQPFPWEVSGESSEGQHVCDSLPHSRRLQTRCASRGQTAFVYVAGGQARATGQCGMLYGKLVPQRTSSALRLNLA